MIQTLNKNFQKSTLLYSFIGLAWPTVLEELLGTILQYVDTAMVGHLGPRATATVSLSSTYTWLLGSVMYAFGIGFLSYIARAIGEKDQQKVEAAANQAAITAIIVGAALTLITIAFAPFMPIVMGAEESIRHDASLYFTLINLPLILRACLTIFGSVIRATGDSKTPMKINLSINVMNIVLNYLFIYALKYGAIGAGYATCISYSIGGLIMCIAFIRNKTLNFHFSNFSFNKTVMGSCLRISLPVVLTQIVSCMGYVVATSFVSSMSTTIYAAHSIAITAEQLFYIPGYGMQAATSTLIGNALGESDMTKVKKIMKISLTSVITLMCVSGLLLFIFAEFMMSIFTTDTTVITTGTRLLRIVAFTEPIFGSAAVMDGIYAGLGKTKPPLYIELITRWGIRILGSFICVRILSLGIDQIWYCMIADNISKSILLAIGLVIVIDRLKKKAEF